MKLRIPALNFKDNEQHREYVLQYITNVVNSDSTFGQVFHSKKNFNFVEKFKPYKHDPSNNNYWTISFNTNWRLLFREDYTNVIEILYRYENADIHVEKILCKWLCFLLNAEIID